MKYVSKLFTTEKEVLTNLGFNPDVSILKSLEFNKETGEIDLLVSSSEKTNHATEVEYGSNVRRQRIEVNHVAKNRVIASAEGEVLIDGKGIHIKEAPKPLPFEDFQQQALHRLQRQFLNTPDNHNTVLTRMNIIQMIKDLKELGLK